MVLYYVNRIAQGNGDHEVHAATCDKLPAEQNRKYLGDFSSCEDAVRKAHADYEQANGCYFCSRGCHTR